MNGQPDVFLTISALAETLAGGIVKQREIELNWRQDLVLPGDWVGLYSHDPASDPTRTLLRVSATDYEGYYKSDVQYGYNASQQAGLKDSCVGYWISYVRAEAVIAVDCLKIRPKWMWQNRLSTFVFCLVLSRL